MVIITTWLTYRDGEVQVREYKVEGVSVCVCRKINKLFEVTGFYKIQK